MDHAPPLLISLNVLTMNVSELSNALTRIEKETSALTFIPYPTGTLVSDNFDVAVDESVDSVQIAEPRCGKPHFANYQDDLTHPLQTYRSFIDSLPPRRAMLTKVTNLLITKLPGFPNTNSHIDIFRLAELCNVHVTTISRTIQNKACRIRNGSIPLSHSSPISGSDKPGNITPVD